jgi:hypothetical protein
VRVEQAATRSAVSEDGVRGRSALLASTEELTGLGHRHREHLADVAAAEAVLQHRCLEPLSLALLAGGGDAGHHPQVGVDDTGLVDRHDTGGGGDAAVHQRALAGSGDAGDDAEDAERDVDVAEVVAGGAADLQRAGRRPHLLLEGGPVVEVAAGDGVAVSQPLDRALEADGAARRIGTGAEVDDVVGDGHEGAVGLVDHPLRLCGDRAEHQRALAGAGDTGEHRQPTDDIVPRGLSFRWNV